MKKRVTGIGGIFFKSEDPTRLNEWYNKHLGLNTTKWGCTFEWKDLDHPDAKAPAKTIWNPFAAQTKYFAPSEKQYMINYRVENLAELMAELKNEGVTIVGEIEDTPYGKFGWVLDLEGNKIELWEPKDDE